MPAILVTGGVVPVSFAACSREMAVRLDPALPGAADMLRALRVTR